VTRRPLHADTPDVARPRAARGFTLVELLAVVTIIAILTGIVLVAAGGVSGARKVALTEDILRSLDRALDEYHTATDKYPAYNADDYVDVPDEDNTLKSYNPGSGVEQHSARPDASVFIKQARGFGEVDAILTGIPDRFLVTTVTGADDDPTPSVIDAWGEDQWPPSADDPTVLFPAATQQLIYYVHPQNDLAQHLYGSCVSGRPYFMSAGADKKYGLVNEAPDDADDRVEAAESYTEDNLYSYPVDPIKTGMLPVARRAPS